MNYNAILLHKKTKHRNNKAHGFAMFCLAVVILLKAGECHLIVGFICFVLYFVLICGLFCISSTYSM